MRAGMTLLEVMLALAILVVLSAGVGSFFFEISARRDQLVRMAAQQRDAALFIDRIEGALLSALAVGPDGTAGVKGDPTSLTVATRAVQPSFDDDAALADACVLRFEFDEREGCCRQTVETGGGSAGEPLLTWVERVRFRYSDGRHWSPSFDSLQAGGLPVAVEVSVWFEPRGGRAPEVVEPPGWGETDAGPEVGDGPAFDEDLGPLDMPAPEPEAPAWMPREPDHVRVISIPDAPDWKERGA